MAPRKQKRLVLNKPLDKIPELTPHRKQEFKHGLTELSPEEYTKLWEEWVDQAEAKGLNEKSKAWIAFQEKHGELIVNGRKFKPGEVKGTKGEWLGSKRLSDSFDKGLDYRKWRGDLATYMFQGTPMSTDQAKGKTEFGDILEAHHKFGNAELAPWFDDIIEYLQHPDPRVRARGRAMMEAGRDYFKDSPYKIGNVMENYELLTKPRHTGGLVGGKIDHAWESAHGALGQGSRSKKAKAFHKDDPFMTPEGEIELGDPGHRVTGPGGKSQWVHPLTGEPLPLTTKIRNLPWRREDSLIDPKHSISGDWEPNRQMTRWRSLELFLENSMPIREQYFEDVKYNRGLDTPNEKAALARLQAGIPDINLDSSVVRNLGTVSGGLSTTDAALNLGVGVATGNYLQAAGGGAGLALQSPAAQKAIAKQIAKRGAKSTLKLIPGVDVVLSGAEAWGYLSEGKFDQAGIAALSGAIGWVPIIGDAAAAGLDITNTGLDIARMDLNNRGELDDPKKKNVNIDIDYKSKNTWNSIYRNIRF